LKNHAGALINIPEATVELIDSMGKSKQYNFEKYGNSYRLNIGLLAKGKYKAIATTQYSGKQYKEQTEFYIREEPIEFFRSHADFDILSNLSKQTNAVFFTLDNISQLPKTIKENNDIKPVLHTIKSTINLIDKHWFFLIILLLAATEWLLRKYWSIH